MKKQFTSIEETNQTIEILKQKPEIDEKISFYKNVLKSSADLVESISERIKKGYTVEKFKFLGVSISKRVMLDSYDVAKLEIEKIETESKIYAQKNYFENWLKRSKDYETKFDEITRECNERWDDVFAKAEGIRTENVRLNMSMSKYSNPDNDQDMKNKFFLYLKQEVENYYKHRSSKFAKA
jgi:hypothetical protein